MSATTPFVRDSLDDDGSVPNNGALNTSPDIIPRQNSVDPSKVQDEFGAATYSQNLGQQIEDCQSNYVYLRAKNPTTEDKDVSISVYWARPSTLLTPSTWQQNVIGTGQPITLPANGGILAAPEPDIWTPQQLPEAGHYCLITELTWDGLDPVPPSFPTLNDWWQYCRDHNTIAQRNIDVVDDIADNKVERWLDLLGDESQVTEHLIEAVCNVPENSTVSLYSPSASLDPPISTGAVVINGTNNGQIVSAQSQFPKSFQGTLQMIFTPPDGAPAGNYSIAIKQYLVDGANLKHLGSYTYDITI